MLVATVQEIDWASLWRSLQQNAVEVVEPAALAFCAVGAQTVSTCRRGCTVDLSEVAAFCVGVYSWCRTEHCCRVVAATTQFSCDCHKTLLLKRLTPLTLKHTIGHHPGAAAYKLAPPEATLRHPKHSTVCLTSIVNNCLLDISSSWLY